MTRPNRCPTRQVKQMDWTHFKRFVITTIELGPYLDPRIVFSWVERSGAYRGPTRKQRTQVTWARLGPAVTFTFGAQLDMKPGANERRA